MIKYAHEKRSEPSEVLSFPLLSAQACPVGKRNALRSRCSHAVHLDRVDEPISLPASQFQSSLHRWVGRETYIAKGLRLRSYIRIAARVLLSTG
jgi:hypothetical protein